MEWSSAGVMPRSCPQHQRGGERRGEKKGSGEEEEDESKRGEEGGERRGGKYQIGEEGEKGRVIGERRGRERKEERGQGVGEEGREGRERMEEERRGREGEREKGERRREGRGRRTCPHTQNSLCGSRTQCRSDHLCGHSLLHSFLCNFPSSSHWPGRAWTSMAKAPSGQSHHFPLLC